MEFFATTEADKVPLFPKDTEAKGKYWVLVKRTLTAGEEQDLIGSALKPELKMGDGSSSVGVELDFAAAAFLKVGLYLVDWNVPAGNGKVPVIDTLPKRLDALKALTMPAYKEIERAIDAHVEELARPKKPGGRGKRSSTTAS